MPLGFGSIKDLAKAVKGPAWVIAIAVAFWLGASILLRACGK
jgi:hypothetical protein